MQNHKFHRVPSAGSRHGTLWRTGLMSMPLLVALSVATTNAQSVDMRSLENALLAENWQKIATLLDEVDLQHPNPVLRLVKGHASLALNRNNEAVCLFLSVFRSEDLARYDRWTTDLVAAATQQSSDFVRYYLRGDALARQSRWDDALVAFRKADQLQATRPLVLNARGVVYAMQHQYDAALYDFYRATELNPRFADAYSNHGVLNIQRRTGAEGALEAFNRALAISQDYALAHAGRGCIRLVLYPAAANEEDSDYTSAARADFEAAARYGQCVADIVANNIQRLFAYLEMDRKVDYTQLSDEELGTELQRLQTAVFRDPNRSNVNSYVNALSDIRNINPNEYARQMTTLQMAASARPGWQQQAAPHFENSQMWNRPGGGAEHLGNAIPRGVSIAGFGVSGIDSKDTLRNQTQRNFATATDVMNRIGLPSGSMGGVTASLASMEMEDGDWPFIAYYGLCYPQPLEQDHLLARGDGK